MSPVCPKCGQESITTISKWGPRHVCCDLWSYNGKDLADGATHRARIEAHELFDAIWKTGEASRKDAYRLLAKQLGLTGAECHIGLMDLATLRRVSGAVWNIRGALHTKATRKCECGNMLSIARSEAGIKQCPKCERAGLHDEAG